MDSRCPPICVLLIDKFEGAHKLPGRWGREVWHRQMQHREVMSRQRFGGQWRFRQCDDSADTLLLQPEKVIIKPVVCFGGRIIFAPERIFSASAARTWAARQQPFD
jgi:hypothetical protein